MGNQGKSIVDLDTNALIEKLNSAYASEWLAHYQYWLGAKLAEGLMKDAVVAELSQHAADEFDHAGQIADRIIQLDGTPLLTPEEWNPASPAKFAAPSDPDVKKLLEQNVEGERKAITFYKELLAFTKDKDPVTYDLILNLLAKEVEHEEDLQRLQEDLGSPKTSAQKVKKAGLEDVLQSIGGNPVPSLGIAGGIGGMLLGSRLRRNPLLGGALGALLGGGAGLYAGSRMQSQGGRELPPSPLESGSGVPGITAPIEPGSVADDLLQHQHNMGRMVL
jgi:bacterioferritin